MKLKVNPDGFMTAIVQIPCVDIDKHGQGKMDRLATEMALSFGPTAQVLLPDGKHIQPED